jgi:hypothetical protein
MLLHLREIPPVPEETHLVAQAIFPQGNTYMDLQHRSSEDVIVSLEHQKRLRN